MGWGSWATGDSVGREGTSGGGEETQSVKRSKGTLCFNVLTPLLARGMGGQLQFDSPGCGYWGSFPATPGLLLPLSEKPS